MQSNQDIPVGTLTSLCIGLSKSYPLLTAPTLEVKNSRSSSLDAIIVRDFAWMHFCDGGYPVHRKMTSSIPGLCSLQFNIIPCPYPPIFEQINCLPFILQCLKGKVLVTQSCLTLCNPMDYSCQVPLFMGFSRQEH